MLVVCKGISLKVEFSNYLLVAVLQVRLAVCNGDKFQTIYWNSTASNACSMQLDKNIKSSMWREERYEQYISEVLH